MTRAVPRDRETTEREEQERLAPWAAHAAESAGRVVSEVPHRYRTAFQRDRDRIVHSRAFRRLEYKTQVFVHHEGDHYRNRLTHTLEGAQIARTMARALRVNEDLAEAIALAHDLGHPPFGHTGERVMNELLEGAGGFDHNWQTLRTVDLLEERYADFRGLNLSAETREGLLKHGIFFEHPLPLPALAAQPSLEAQLADLADEIAYINHDLDDGLRSALVQEGQLEELELWRVVGAEVRDRFPRADPRILRSQHIATLIDALVTAAIEATAERLTRAQPADLDALRRHPDRFAGLPAPMAAQVRELKLFLYDNLYYHPAVRAAAAGAEEVVRILWNAYRERPGELPEGVSARTERDGERRAVADYLAGMTDRFARAEAERFARAGDADPAG